VQILLESFTWGLSSGIPIMFMAACRWVADDSAARIRRGPWRWGDRSITRPASRKHALGASCCTITVSIVCWACCFTPAEAAGPLGLLGLFCAMAQLGVIVSAVTPLANHSREIDGRVIGIFMHLSTTICREERRPRFNRGKTAAIILERCWAFWRVPARLRRMMPPRKACVITTHSHGWPR